MKKIEFIVKKLDELSNDSNIVLLSKDEILKKSNSIFSTSGFATKNKKETLSIAQNNRIIFGLEEGFIFTDNGFYFLTIIGNTNCFHFDFEDFLKLKANNHSLIETGKLIINGNFITNENRLTKFQLEIYEKIKVKIEEALSEHNEFLKSLENEAILNEKIE